jgi:RNA polymerase sigma-70 factor (ECF subfamily)
MDKSHSAKESLFIELYAKHEPSVRAFVKNGIFYQHDVADVMQKIAMVAWKKFGDLDDPNLDFGKWMCVIARYEIMKFRRGKRRDILILSETAVEKILDQGCEEYSSRIKTLEFLQTCIDSLKEEEKTLIKIAYNSNTSIKAFAKTLNKSAQATYQKLQRIRNKLADCVEFKLSTEKV